MPSYQCCFLDESGKRIRYAELRAGHDEEAHREAMGCSCIRAVCGVRTVVRRSKNRGVQAERGDEFPWDEVVGQQE